MIANSVSAVYSMRQKSKPWLVSIAVMMAASQLLGVDLDGSWGFRFEEGKPLEEVAKGDVNAVHFPVRKIVETAVISKAVSVILTHNHPGGTLSPSREDLDATEAAKTALGTIGVRLLDHLIVSGEDYYSLRENGYL